MANAKSHDLSYEFDAAPFHVLVMPTETDGELTAEDIAVWHSEIPGEWTFNTLLAITSDGFRFTTTTPYSEEQVRIIDGDHTPFFAPNSVNATWQFHNQDRTVTAQERHQIVLKVAAAVFHSAFSEGVEIEDNK